jgi:hypothetical protein
VVVEGRPLGQSQPVLTIAGGPSIVDVPTAGCWTFRLSWRAPTASTVASSTFRRSRLGHYRHGRLVNEQGPVVRDPIDVGGAASRSNRARIGRRAMGYQDPKQAIVAQLSRPRRKPVRHIAPSTGGPGKVARLLRNPA